MYSLDPDPPAYVAPPPPEPINYIYGYDRCVGSYLFFRYNVLKL